MKQKTCECGKRIEGFSEAHVDYQMKQHMMSKKHNTPKLRAVKTPFPARSEGDRR